MIGRLSPVDVHRRVLAAVAVQRRAIEWISGAYEHVADLARHGWSALLRGACSPEEWREIRNLTARFGVDEAERLAAEQGEVAVEENLN